MQNIIRYKITNQPGLYTKATSRNRKKKRKNRQNNKHRYISPKWSEIHKCDRLVMSNRERERAKQRDIRSYFLYRARKEREQNYL